MVGRAGRGAHGDYSSDLDGLQGGFRAKVSAERGPHKALIDSRYAWWLNPRAEVTRVPEALRRRWPGWLVRLGERFGPLRALLVFLLARGHDVVALPGYARGLATFMSFEAFVHRGPRRLVLLEEIDFGGTEGRRLLERAVLRFIRRPAARRALAAVQVLTRADVARQEAAEPHLAGRFVYVPWAWRATRTTTAPPALPGEGRHVLSSGRSQSDWETLFAAARGCRWRLTAVCGVNDLSRVRELNAGVGAEVLCEIPREEHKRLLSAATVYVVSVRATGVHAGHVRLMAAMEAGVPVVVTRAPALEDYVEEGETALVTPGGDAAALRSAIERLLEDRELRQRLRDTAWRRSQAWTYADYVAALGSLVDDVAESGGAVPAGRLGPPS